MADGTVVPSALTSVGNVAKGFEHVPGDALSGVRTAVGAVAGAHAGSLQSTKMLGTVGDCWAANFHSHGLALFEVGTNLVSTAADYQNTDAANENEFGAVHFTPVSTGLVRPI